MNNAFINRPTTVKTHLSVALTALTTVGTGIALPNFAYAQLEEVVVTARARSESLQDVPSTVTAFTAGQINDMGTVSYTHLTLPTN